MIRERFTITEIAPYPFRAGLSRFLRSYATTATLSRSGQQYLDGVVRLACPGFITAISSTDTFLHASSVIAETINTVMSPCIHRTVARQYEDVKWSACTREQFMLAAAILADATGESRFYINGDILRCKHADGPALFISHDLDIPYGDTVGFIDGTRMYVASSSFIDVLGAFLEAMPSNGIHAALAKTAPPPPRLTSHFL